MSFGAQSSANDCAWGVKPYTLQDARKIRRIFNWMLKTVLSLLCRMYLTLHCK